MEPPQMAPAMLSDNVLFSRLLTSSNDSRMTSVLKKVAQWTGWIEDKRQRLKVHQQAGGMEGMTAQSSDVATVCADFTYRHPFLYTRTIYNYTSSRQSVVKYHL